MASSAAVAAMYKVGGERTACLAAAACGADAAGTMCSDGLAAAEVARTVDLSVACSVGSAAVSTFGAAGVNVGVVATVIP